MKRTLAKPVFIAVLLLAMTLFIGCNSDKNTGGPLDNYVKVEIEGDGVFPACMVGTWKDKDFKWEFEFDSSGNIVRAVIDSGLAEIVPSEGEKVLPTKDGRTATYKLGIWNVHYVPTTRQLTVQVVVEEMAFSMGENRVEGKMVDIFDGVVTEDCMTWSAEWTPLYDIKAITPPDPPAPLPVDPWIQTKYLIFNKDVDSEKTD